MLLVGHLNIKSLTDMEKPKESGVKESIIVAVHKALVEKKEWVRKVQSGEITYTKGKRIA